jgi:hypothetical protein
MLVLSALAGAGVRRRQKVIHERTIESLIERHLAVAQ